MIMARLIQYPHNEQGTLRPKMQMIDILISNYFAKKRMRHDNSNKIKSGSVIPKSEFSTIRGWNIKNTVPRRDNPFPQNFLHRIKTGIIVITEIIVVIYRWRSL